jgi:hypothetical protein
VITKDIRRRPSRAVRSFGYLIAMAVNAVLLYLANVRPGWQAVTFLTEDAPRVLLLFNISLVTGIVVNLGHVLCDAPRWRALGDLITNGVSLAVLVKLWVVFPFAFDAHGWAIAARTLLTIAMAGTAIAMLVQVISACGGTIRSASGRT